MAIDQEVIINPKIFKSLQQYNADIKLRKEAMKLIVQNLADQEIEDLKEMFNAIDTGKTGYIDAQELKEAMNQCEVKLAQEEIDTIANKSDYNYSEFIAATLNSQIYMDEEKL